MLIALSAAVALFITYFRIAAEKHEPADLPDLPDNFVFTRIVGLEAINILVDNIFDEFRYNDDLRSLEKYMRYGKTVALRSGFVQLVRDLDAKKDYEITYAGLTVRNEVLKYNWFMKTKQFYYLRNSDAILGKYGLVMRRVGSRYLPEHLETGRRIEFFANRELIEQAIGVVNYSRVLYPEYPEIFSPEQGKDLFDVETFLAFDESNKTIDPTLDLYGISISGKELLDLFGVEIRWNRKEKQYELASNIPEPGPGILGREDLELLEESARRYRLANPEDGGMHDVVNPLELYYLGVNAGTTDGPGGARPYKAYDKTTGTRLYILEEQNFPPSAAAIPVIYYKLLEKISSILREHYESLSASAPASEKARVDLMVRHYDQLQQYYARWLLLYSPWQEYLREICKISLHWNGTGFEAKDLETNKTIVFGWNEDLVNEALRELNCYKEKCDFVKYFQTENYPMFLLSILRLYDVNLELDKATNKYVIAPGPTDPERFFDIVAEFTFVNDSSDTEYLKEHLTSWLEPEPATERDKKQETAEESG